MKMLMPALCLALVVFGLSCKKDIHAKDPLFVDKKNITFQGHSGIIDSITIQYPGNWSISKNPATASWLSYSATSGAGNATIYVSTTENNTLNAARSAVIVITPDGDESRKERSRKLPALTVTKKENRLTSGRKN